MSLRLLVTAFGLLALVGAPFLVDAQAPSVQAPGATLPGRAQTLPGGLVRGLGMSVRELIRDAYGYRNRAHGEIVG